VFKYLIKNTCNLLNVSVDEILEKSSFEFMNEIINFINKKYRIKTIIV
jgi:hypothetical protein